MSMQFPSASLVISLVFVALAVAGIGALVSQESITDANSQHAVAAATANAAPLSFRFRAFPQTVRPGEDVVLSWHTEGTTACYLHGPNLSITKTSGFHVVKSIQRSANYTLFCTLPNSNAHVAQRSIEVEGKPSLLPKPACTITSSPNTLRPNTTTTSKLTWTSSNAARLFIDPGVGLMPLNGNKSVRPATTTLYAAYAVGPGGYNVCDTTVVALSNYNSCVLDGEVVPHGFTRNFFNRAAAPLDRSCASYAQERRCNNGVLSGSSTYNKSRCTSGIDMELPNVYFTSPATTTAKGVITVAATATDNRGVQNVTFKYQTEKYGTATIATDTTSPYSTTLNTGRFHHNSIVMLHAVARDVKGNIATSSRAIVIHNPVAPSATPVGGAYVGAQNITLSLSGIPNTIQSSIRYTTNGANPSCTTGTVYAGPIALTATKTIKAIACYRTGPSEVKTFAYTIRMPVTASPAAGAYAGARNVTLTAPGSSSIRYTINGANPTCTTGTVYASPIAITATKTIKAVACYPTGALPVQPFAYEINPVFDSVPDPYINNPGN